MMSDPADPANPTGPNKWSVMAQTMPDVFDSLPDGFAVGEMLYNLPSGTYAGKQAVPIAPLGAPGTAQRTSIDSSINIYTPNGYTPTYNAWEFGMSQLVNLTPATGYELSPKYIVLITDGVPTIDRDGRTIHGSGISQAEYDWQISSIQADGAAAGIRTFVMGVVGSDNPQGATYDPLYMLSKLAVAGGTSASGCVPSSGVPQASSVNPRGTYCHLDLSQVLDLSTAIKQAVDGIAKAIIPCDYAIPPPPTGLGPIDPAKTAVVYNDGAGRYSLILQNTSGTCDTGWVFSDSTKSKLHLCGLTCDAVHANVKATLNLVFGCATSSIPLGN